jgi:hypothetical protein
MDRYESYFQGALSEEFVLKLFSRLKSPITCEKIIRKKKSEQELSNDLITKKAMGVSASIESALGFFNTHDSSLNSIILSRYYFLLQLTIAEQVGSLNNMDSLESIELYTKQGHGIKTIQDSESVFPFNFFSYIQGSGYLAKYLIFLGITDKSFIINDKIDKYNIGDPQHFVSILDLFRRIPELANVIEDHIEVFPLTFRVAVHRRDFNADNGKKVAYATIYSNHTADEISSLNTILKNPKEIPYKELGFSNTGNVTAYEIKYEGTKMPNEIIKLYKSGMASDMFICPLYNNIDDHIAIHLMLLYNLSIIVRYYPSLWHQIEKGDLNQFASLIDYYIYTFDQVIPISMLQRITGTRISITTKMGGAGS